MEKEDLLGLWTWDGHDCAKANVEIRPDRLILTTLDGVRTPLFKLIEGPRSEKPAHFLMHLEPLPHPSMTEDERRALGLMSVLLILEDDRITPRVQSHGDYVETLAKEDNMYQLLNLVRCS